jgi:hypothetical protein
VSTEQAGGEGWIAAMRWEEAEAEAIRRERYRHGVESGYAGEIARAALSDGLSDEIPGMLYQAWQDGHINTSSLRDTVPEVWIYNKSPGRCLGQRAWVRMFKAAGFLCRTEEWAESGVAVSPRFEISWTRERPAGQLTVWRGAALSTGDRGMSWTLHRECAADFANKVWAGAEAGIYQAEIPGRAVLAVFGDPREQEIVVNPSMLRGRIVLDERLAAKPLLPWPPQR